VTGRGAVFFETGCMVLLLTTVGRYLEALARASAGASLQARLRLGGDTAEKLVDGERVVVAISSLVPGDRVRVPIGREVPADAVVDVNDGWASFAMLTGESDARPLKRGDRIAAGAVVERVPLEIVVAATARDSALEKLARLAESARARRSRVEGLADRLAAMLIPLVTVLALSTFALTHARLGFEPALVRALAIVLVACPCSFGLAVPLAMVRALDEAAVRSVIVRGADVLERMASVRRVVFDKTGTLTESGLRVERVAGLSVSDDELLALAASLERDVEHPIARAIVAEARKRDVTPKAARLVEAFRGGIRGEVAGRQLSIGRGDDPDVIDVTDGGITIGRIFLGESIRREAKASLDELRALGLSVELATGDASSRASATARALGLEATTAMSPQQKLARIEAIESKDEVAMVGDGHNDAPALAGASVGIALGSGADVTQGVAGVCIVDSDLTKLPWLVTLARRARSIARQNLAWALVYNGAFLTLAVLGKLNPTLAAVAMLGSSVAVVVNSMRIGVAAPPVPSATPREELAT
jgi:heavy metal translocating P-type ATPase